MCRSRFAPLAYDAGPLTCTIPFCLNCTACEVHCKCGRPMFRRDTAVVKAELEARCRRNYAQQFRRIGLTEEEVVREVERQMAYLATVET